MFSKPRRERACFPLQVTAGSCKGGRSARLAGHWQHRSCGWAVTAEQPLRSTMHALANAMAPGHQLQRGQDVLDLGVTC